MQDYAAAGLHIQGVQRHRSLGVHPQGCGHPRLGRRLRLNVQQARKLQIHKDYCGNVPTAVIRRGRNALRPDVPWVIEYIYI